jgi:putative flippase GtrA
VPPLSCPLPTRHRPARASDLALGPLGGIAVAIASLAFVRFAVVGSIGLVVDMAIFRAFTLLDFSDAAARAVSLGCAIVLTWRLNRVFTFRPSGRAQAVESSRYAVVALAAQSLNYTLFLWLRVYVPDLHDLLALVLSAGAAAGFSFTGHRFFTFARTGRACVVEEHGLVSSKHRASSRPASSSGGA